MIRKVIIQVTNGTNYIISFNAKWVIEYNLSVSPLVMNLCVRYQKYAFQIHVYRIWR